MDITIRIEDKPVIDALNRLARKGADLSPAMKVIGEDLVQSTWQRFNAGGPAPDGKAWAPPVGNLFHGVHKRVFSSCILIERC